MFLFVENNLVFSQFKLINKLNYSHLFLLPKIKQLNLFIPYNQIDSKEDNFSKMFGLSLIVNNFQNVKLFNNHYFCYLKKKYKFFFLFKFYCIYFNDMFIEELYPFFLQFNKFGSLQLCIKRINQSFLELEENFEKFESFYKIYLTLYFTSIDILENKFLLNSLNLGIII